MKNLDLNLNELSRAFIGADQITALLQGLTQRKQQSYPPYNIEQLSENSFLISMAVAGFSEDELSIKSEQNKLIVEGTKPEDKQDRHFVHRGLANRNFSREFQLGEHILVDGAQLENGILNIELHRIIPESKQPKTIAISRAEPT